MGNTARISLDLPRPESPWNLPRVGASSSTPRTPEGPLSRSGSPSKGHHKRPMSMQINSSPQLTPSVTVESPKSPSKGLFSNRGTSRSPERLLNNAMLNKVQGLVSQQSSRSSTRPTTPKSETGDTAAYQESRAVHLKHNGLAGHIETIHRPSAVPPAAKPSEKPRIPAKPAPLTAQDLGNLIPERRKMSTDKRISPFSTPPSSEGSQSPHESPDRAAARARSQARKPKPEHQLGGTAQAAHDTVKPQVQPTTGARLMGFSQPRTVTEWRDPRTLGFSTAEHRHETKTDAAMPVRANTISTRSTPRDTGFAVPRPSQRHVSETVRSLPPPLQLDQTQTPRSAPIRDPRQLGFSSPAQSVTPVEENRPGLPPRRGGGEPPPRPSDDSKPGITMHHNRLPPSASVGRTLIAAKPLQNAAIKPLQEPQNYFPPLRKEIPCWSMTLTYLQTAIHLLLLRHAL